jgi:hypothetical protein
MRKRMSLLAVMALAALVMVGLSLSAGSTTATFTATTTNPGNQFTSATLTMSNDKPNAGDLISISNLVPGDTATRTVTVTNTGNVGFTYSAAASSTTNTLLFTGANGLSVVAYRCNCTTPANQVYSGTVQALSLPTSGTIAASGTETLTFVFSFPTAADNTYQTKTETFTITYTATQLAGTAR